MGRTRRAAAAALAAICLTATMILGASAVLAGPESAMVANAGSVIMAQSGGQSGAPLVAPPPANNAPPAALDIPGTVVTGDAALPPTLSGPAMTAVAPAELEAFVDGLVGGYMRDEKINGAVVAVVRRDQTLLLKGYGADRTDGRPVDPERTLFRIASISKTFTWLSLLQLIDEGKVQLDAPINAYLPDGAKVRDQGYAQPILVRHLLSHSAGFEDAFAGRLFRATMRNAPTMEQELALRPPSRVRAPGEAAIYSNYGSVLAGLIVQTVGGQEFQARTEARLFGPLGMQRTTFREPYDADPNQPAPMSEALAKDISQGFSWRAGAAVERPFEFVTPNAPAGGASTTALDMTRFMRMFLNKGALDGQRVLAAETIAKLEGPALFANAPGMNGLAYGFMQTQSRKGWRAYGHGGNTLWFASWMAIYPELDLGVFVVGNTEGASRKLQFDVPRAIVDRFFPESEALGPLPKPDPAAQSALARLAGQYLVDRRNFTTVEKAFCLVGCVITVSATPEGQIVVSAGAESARLTPIDVKVEAGRSVHRFRNVETNEISAFIVESGGQIVRYAGANGVARSTRVDWPQQPSTLTTLLYVALVVGLLAGLSGLWRAVRRRREGSESRVAGILVPLTGWAWVGVIGLYGIIFTAFSADPWSIFAAWPPSLLPIAQWGAIVATLLTAITAVMVALAWRGADWSGWRRLRLIFTLGVFAVTPFGLAQWNLLGALS